MGQESCSWTEQTEVEKKEMRHLKKKKATSEVVERHGRSKENLQQEKNI